MEINKHGSNDDHHGHNHYHTRPTSKIRLLVVILFNIIITLAEFIGGVMSGSLSLISDAWHNLSDVLALMLGYAGEKVSEREGGKHYTFGLKRFEVLIALVNALSLLGIGIYIVYEAIERFVNPSPINIKLMIPVAIIGLLGNGFSIFVLVKNKDDNLNMKAAFIHLLYDTISSVAVIGAGIFIYFTNILWIDLLISLIIVIMMVLSSMGIIKESFRIFLQGSPENIDPEEVYKLIENFEFVESIHSLHIWSVSSNEIFLSCHICILEKNEDTDVVIKKINTMLEDNYGIMHTTLQIEKNKLCDIEKGNCCNC